MCSPRTQPRGEISDLPDQEVMNSTVVHEENKTLIRLIWIVSCIEVLFTIARLHYKIFEINSQDIDTLGNLKPWRLLLVDCNYGTPSPVRYILYNYFHDR